MFTVEWTPEAFADLERCYAFLASRNLKAARSAITTIVESVHRLSIDPHRYPKLESVPHQRKLSIHWGKYGYKIRFRIEGDSVYILSVYHGRENRPPL